MSLGWRGGWVGLGWRGGWVGLGWRGGWVGLGWRGGWVGLGWRGGRAAREAILATGLVESRRLGGAVASAAAALGGLEGVGGL